MKKITGDNLTNRPIKVVQVVLVIIGIVLIAIALSVDWLGIGYPGFGLSQTILTTTGCGLLFTALILRVNKIRQWTQWILLSKITLVFGGLIIGLITAEIGLYALERIGFYQSEDGGLIQTIPDPKLGVRLPPYAPGHDAKGFRNDRVPGRVDIVAIGDSQTWGINASRAQAWPQTLARLSNHRVYNMALGYYSPVQYWVLVEEALELSPQIIVVGLYFGNDIWGAYQIVYPREIYTQFRHHTMTEDLLEDTIAPRAKALLNESQSLGTRQLRHSPLAVWSAWLVRHSATARRLDQYGWWPGNSTEDQYQAARAWAQAFPDHGAVYENGNVRTIFTTAYRLLALDLDEPRIVEGLRITQEVLQRIQAETDAADVKLLVVFIPTKESVYADAMKIEGRQDQTYARLVRMEAQVRTEVISLCEKSNIQYIDLLPALTAAVEQNEQIYPPNTDGHPNAQGYFLIASTINDALIERGW